MNASRVNNAPHIVVIGGGTGCPAVLKGLQEYTPNLTAVVTVMDSGGSTGRLRQEFGIPAMGDLRRCLTIMSNPEREVGPLRDLMEYRFQGNTDLGNHSLGNLLLAALTDKFGSLEAGIGIAAQLLGVNASILPVTLASTHLVGILDDGSLLEGEASIDQRGSNPVGLRGIMLQPTVTANPRAIQAIRSADAVVLGPGDLFTSVLPNLLVNGIAEAIAESQAKKVFIGNLVIKPGETEGYRLSDFLLKILEYLRSKDPFDIVLADAEALPAPIGSNHPCAGSPAVEVDRTICMELTRCLALRPLADKNSPWVHDPERTAAALVEALGKQGCE